MRLSIVLIATGLVACSNDVDPRVIAGGGVSDGEIDGEINVAVIDQSTDNVIPGATVDVGGTQKTTDTKGFATFSDVEGAQTVIVKMSGYRSAVWVDVNGANVTIGLQPNSSTTPPQATLSGTITGWDAITVPQGHAKAAFVITSQTTDLGDPDNDVPTGAGNVCIAGTECNWTLNSRTGSVTVIAVLIDRDLHGTLTNPDDDTNKIIGWAYKTGVTVETGVNQSGLVLSQVEAGNLQTVTVDLGTPPPSLTERLTLVGIELSKDEVIQMPLFIEATDATSILAPKPGTFGGTASYRLTAIAQSTSGEMGAQSAVIRTGLASTALAAGTWLLPPTSVMATRSSASFEPVAGARAHSANWRDGAGVELLEITSFNVKIKQFDVPALVALPTSGTLTARVNAIGADLDPNDFSLDDDSDQIWGFAAEPASIP
ncbi:MAG TPA: hypothetical protein VMZ53_02070 [Kofleriaceae bacterium]|nr:hypothetical protein [Kofleriaceae bacterium]